jgi:APA family basic amino acid/polyamine antiporter
MIQSPPSSPASPKLSLADATLIGVASMLGAGVFVVFSSAYALAGSFLLVSVLLAGLVAGLNARSVRQLATVLPRAGGAYGYGREFISHSWGFLAGVAFIFGKIGSVAAIALAAASYIYPAAKVEVAILSLILMTGINLLGIKRTALASLVLTAATLALLLLVGFVGLQFQSVSTYTSFSLQGVLTAASLIFFAFAGYARAATLSEDVRNPSVNVPRAIVIGLTVVLSLYILVANALQNGLGLDLQFSSAPLRDFVEISIPWLPTEVVIIIAASSCLGSLLSLLAGISRTAEAMALDGELPRLLGRRSSSFNTPWVVELLIAAIAMLLVMSGDLVWTIGISSFSVLLYYSIANFAAFKQLGRQKTFSRVLALIGLAFCLILAVLVPLQSLLLGSALLVLSLLVRGGLKKSGQPR